MTLETVQVQPEPKLGAKIALTAQQKITLEISARGDTTEEVAERLRSLKSEILELAQQ